MKINTYVINLDRSPDRWEAISADAARVGLDLIRVPAVDGKSAPEAERSLLDEAAFRRDHGKRPMPGEFGCYASHIRALEAFLASEADFALILEDDVVPAADIGPALASIASVDDWDLAKLKNNRMAGFRPERSIEGGRRLGRAPFGPTGSSAAYLVNRFGAERLVAGLSPMTLPYDVAFERGWVFGIRVRHVAPNLVSINQATKKSVLLDGGRGYGAMKLKPWNRLTTLRFRTIEFARRLAYGLGSPRP